MPATQPQPQNLRALIGDPIELGSAFYYTKVNFIMPDIASLRTGQNYTGQPISADVIINLTGTDDVLADQVKRQAIADAAAAAYAMQLIGKEWARINNL